LFHLASSPSHDIQLLSGGLLLKARTGITKLLGRFNGKKPVSKSKR